MSQSEWFTTYLEYESLKEMLNIILYTSQSFMVILLQLYYITYRDNEILFIHTGLVGGRYIKHDINCLPFSYTIPYNIRKDVENIQICTFRIVRVEYVCHDGS
jgi:hypothetical protein